MTSSTSLLAERLHWIERGRRDPVTAARIVGELARRDPAWWINVFVDTADPRQRRSLPFHLFPKQEEYIRILHECCYSGEELLVEKSRDVGITWLSVAYAANRFLFAPGFASTFGANRVDLVDQLWDQSSILEKLRMILRALPKWQLPTGFDMIKHALHCRIINPANGNTVLGEGGDNIGRGGRATLLFIDEAAHLSRAEAVNASTSATADCRVWTSSVSGLGNFFARKRRGGDCRVFTFHWKHDPRKTADPDWEEKTRRRVGPVTFAAEYDIDYGASVTGILIQKAWIDAAIELYDHPDIPGHLRGATGLDVGAGRDLSTTITRRGPLVLPIKASTETDSWNVAHWALDRALEDGAKVLIYDAIGVGTGVTAAMARREMEKKNVHVVAHNGGHAPTDRRWQDGRTSKEIFHNRRAEVWWLMREAIRRAYEKWLWLKGDQKQGFDHPWDEVLVLPNDTELANELNTPTSHTSDRGKIIIESKDDMRKRNGGKSPDRADALAMTFDFAEPEDWAPTDIEVFESSMAGGW